MRKKYYKGVGLVMSALLTLTMLGGNTMVMANNEISSQINKEQDNTYIKQVIPENDYSIKLKKENDKKLKITLRNKGIDDIAKLSIDIKTENKSVKTSLGNIKNEYGYASIESDYTLHKGYSKEIIIEFDEDVDLEGLKNITICGEKTYEEGEYDDIEFNAYPNYNDTSKVIKSEGKLLNIEENRENEIGIRITNISGNDDYNYKGSMDVTIDNQKHKISVVGNMFVSEEGVLGTLSGKLKNDVPISATINYTKSNEEPYVFLAIGDAIKENDKYFIYGQRKSENDELSNQKIESEGETSSIEPVSTGDYNSMVIDNEDSSESEDLNIISSSESTSAYDTVFQGLSMKGYVYKNKVYPLIATSLYSPSKQKSNSVYCLRGKVNEQMANADYYITQVCHNYGAVMTHDATSKLELYTENKNVQMTELDPETTSWCTFSASIPVPYLSASINYFSISFPSISAKRYKINNSTKYNKAVWKFNDHVNCSFNPNPSSNRYPKKLKKAYAGQCDVVYYKNNNRSYKLNCKGYIYYSGTIGLGHYRTDYSFNVSTSISKKITTVVNK